MHATDDQRALAVCLTAPGSVGKFGRHSIEANQKSSSQLPEGTLPKEDPQGSDLEGDGW